VPEKEDEEEFTDRSVPIPPFYEEANPAIETWKSVETKKKTEQKERSRETSPEPSPVAQAETSELPKLEVPLIKKRASPKRKLEKKTKEAKNKTSQKDEKTMSKPVPTQSDNQQSKPFEKEKHNNTQYPRTKHTQQSTSSHRQHTEPMKPSQQPYTNNFSSKNQRASNGRQRNDNINNAVTPKRHGKITRWKSSEITDENSRENSTTFLNLQNIHSTTITPDNRYKTIISRARKHCKIGQKKVGQLKKSLKKKFKTLLRM